MKNKLEFLLRLLMNDYNQRAAMVNRFVEQEVGCEKLLCEMEQIKAYLEKLAEELGVELIFEEDGQEKYRSWQPDKKLGYKHVRIRRTKNAF